MATGLILDAEAIIGDYLREHPSVVVLGARVVPQTPPSTSAPWVRLTQLDARNDPISRHEHLVSYMLQLDCYAGTDGDQQTASVLARTVRAVLVEMPGVHAAAVVTSTRFTGMPRIPDQAFEPAMERYVLTAIVHMHARPDV